LWRRSAVGERPVLVPCGTSLRTVAAISRKALRIVIRILCYPGRAPKQASQRYIKRVSHQSGRPRADDLGGRSCPPAQESLKIKRSTNSPGQRWHGCLQVDRPAVARPGVLPRNYPRQPGAGPPGSRATGLRPGGDEEEQAIDQLGPLLNTPVN